jgi:acetoin utilization deacetylase AcuC-like enzyme
MCAGNPGIFTLSVHAANNYPARKQRSTLDVPLPDGVGDDVYLDTVAQVCV